MVQALQEAVDRLATALGEANFFGSLLSLRHAAASGQQRGCVEGWEELEPIVNAGFGSLILANANAAAALREHDRLTAELAGDPLLARLVAAQNARLHAMAEQGLEHPVFTGEA